MLIQNWSILFFSFSISSCWKRYPRAFLLDKEEDHPVKIYAICIQLDCLPITTGRCEFGKRQAILISQPGRKLFGSALRTARIYLDHVAKVSNLREDRLHGYALNFLSIIWKFGICCFDFDARFSRVLFASVMWTTHDKSWRILRCLWTSLMLLALNGKRSHEIFCQWVKN